MDLVKDDATAIYISAGLFAFLVLLWISTACFSKGPCNDFNQPVHTKSENVKMPLFLGKFTKLFPCNFTSIIISKITNFKFVILQSI